MRQPLPSVSHCGLLTTVTNYQPKEKETCDAGHFCEIKNKYFFSVHFTVSKTNIFCFTRSMLGTIAFSYLGLLLIEWAIFSQFCGDVCSDGSRSWRSPMIAYSLGGGLLTASRSLATALRGARSLAGLLRHVPPAVIHLRACDQYS